MEFRRIGIVGLGGLEIAAACARAGLDVLLVQESEAGCAEAARLIGGMLDATSLARVRHAVDAGSLATSDIVIEAASSDDILRRDKLRALGRLIRPDAVLASLNAGAGLEEIAPNLRRPARVLGIDAALTPAPTSLTAPEAVDVVWALAMRLMPASPGA